MSDCPPIRFTAILRSIIKRGLEGLHRLQNDCRSAGTILDQVSGGGVRWHQPCRSPPHLNCRLSRSTLTRACRSLRFGKRQFSPSYAKSIANTLTSFRFEASASSNMVSVWSAGRIHGRCQKPMSASKRKPFAGEALTSPLTKGSRAPFGIPQLGFGPPPQAAGHSLSVREWCSR
jgi:hypothetical protein